MEDVMFIENLEPLIYWTKTNNLRIYNGTLQQMSISSEGKTRWDDIEVINN